MTRRTADDFAAEQAAKKQAKSATLAALNNEHALQEHAEEIRRLGKRVVEDVIEIGRRLTEAKKIAAPGHWLEWLKREFEWTDRQALNYTRVYAMASRSENFSDLSIPVSGLYLLAAPSTPGSARDEILNRAEAGEEVSVADVKNVIAGHKLPQPEEVPAGDDAPGHDCGRDQDEEPAYGGDQGEDDDPGDQGEDDDAPAAAEEQPDEENEEADEPINPIVDAAVRKAVAALVAAVRGKTDLQIAQISAAVHERLFDAMPNDGTLGAHWRAQAAVNRSRGAKRAAETRKRRAAALAAQTGKPFNKSITLDPNQISTVSGDPAGKTGRP